MKIFKNGLITGLVLQLAIGPVFFFIINLALQKSIWDGLAGVIAVTLVDYFYIILSILGIGKLLEKKKFKKVFGIISSIVLVVFGVLIIQSVLAGNSSVAMEMRVNSVFASFMAVFFLTISNPMTIIWNTSFFTAKTVEFNYSKHELWIFGLAFGLATSIFMGVSVIALGLLKTAVPVLLIKFLNIIVGCLLIGYGGIRLVKTTKK